eukprot:symbB.v1.2.021427.t2/scaffold1844.1/size99053/7
MNTSELQGHAIGTWNYQNGSCYRVVVDGDDGDHGNHLVFEERHADGREVRGMLLQEDAWLVGRLIYRDTGEVSGTVMLQFADGLDTLVSFFQPHGSSGWVQAMATRAGKAQILHRKGPRPLPKSLVQGSLSGIYSSYPEPSQEDLGWSPILRDCVLHSLKARVAYLEEAISSQRSEAAVTLRGCQCAERGGWYDTSVSAQSLKAKTLARTIWSQVDVKQAAPPEKGVGGKSRTCKRDQAVQCMEEQLPPSAPSSPISPSPVPGLPGPAPAEPTEMLVESPDGACQCSVPTQRNVHLQAVLERQNRRCVVLAEDVAVLAEELGKIRSQPLAATGLWVSSSMGGQSMQDAVDLLGDGKVLKKVLREGDGEFPKLGDRVTVHYTCRLEDDTIVDDSRGTPWYEGNNNNTWIIHVAASFPPHGDGERSTLRQTSRALLMSACASCANDVKEAAGAWRPSLRFGLGLRFCFSLRVRLMASLPARRLPSHQAGPSRQAQCLALNTQYEK